MLRCEGISVILVRGVSRPLSLHCTHVVLASETVKALEASQLVPQAQLSPDKKRYSAHSSQGTHISMPQQARTTRHNQAAACDVASAARQPDRAAAHPRGVIVASPALAACFCTSRRRRLTAPKVGLLMGGPLTHCCTRDSRSRWAFSTCSIPAVSRQVWRKHTCNTVICCCSPEWGR